jgi:hypothetical protein
VAKLKKKRARISEFWSSFGEDVFIHTETIFYRGFALNFVISANGVEKGLI